MLKQQEHKTRLHETNCFLGPIWFNLCDEWNTYCARKEEQISPFLLFCFVNSEKSLNICESKKEERKRKGLHLFSFSLLLSNQIQLGFCCPIIEMFKCENRSDLHFERNVFTSTNENVPVALAIRSAHLSSWRKIEIVLRKWESPQTKAIPFMTDKQPKPLERVSFVWKHSLSHAFERVAWCRNEGCLLRLLWYGPIAVRQYGFTRLMFKERESMSSWRIWSVD